MPHAIVNICITIVLGHFLRWQTKRNGSAYKKIIQCEGQQMSQRQQSPRTGDICGQRDSGDQRLVEMLVGITVKLRVRDEFEGEHCGVFYLVLSILSLPPCTI